MSLLDKHHFLTRRGVWLSVFILITALIGTSIELLPLAFTDDMLMEKVEGVRPYSPLELAGRNIYIREGCYTCHSQMIRSLKGDVDRYGFISLAVESRYDHPFQWGSRRIGPDLARLGGKYTNQWHVLHLDDPQGIVAGSLMPSYEFLNRPLHYEDIADHLTTLSYIGVPYTKEDIARAQEDLEAQAYGEAGRPDGSMVDLESLAQRYHNAMIGDFDGQPNAITEMDALIAYLQVLGRMVAVDPDTFFSVPENLR